MFQALCEEVKEAVNDSEIRACVISVDKTMNRFDFLLAERLLQHTGNLSKTLQIPSQAASEGQQVSDLTCKVIGRM